MNSIILDISTGWLLLFMALAKREIDDDELLSEKY